MKHRPVSMLYSPNAHCHFCVEMMKAVKRGPKYGDSTTKAAQMFILRACSCR